ncbi:putative PurR-regulated permease PerM [Catenuloplanes nepalensis]|uniref:PurR-regulated permease PerM n=1 Tax=Catenuloplanes nepalensis TaxID=587533 RepID=A0ABT9MKK8_9ACTN|nr:AI-2E family transporter [Catenuloplanes nepalensis]MDP9791601.1 putative PurR-regulated permease PerM [Catenuloplanes nepalensis]
MTWVNTVRRRARSVLADRARDVSLPPFIPSQSGSDLPPVVMMEPAPTTDDLVPRGVRIAGSWAWRIILFVAAGYLLIRVIGLLRVVIIPVAVALLLAALFEPVSARMRRHGVHRSVAAALVLLAALVLVFGGLGLIVQTFIAQYDDLARQVGDGIDEVQAWLTEGPLHLSQGQLNGYVEALQQQISGNQGALTTGAISTAATVGEMLTGFFLVLFTLFFMLRDGGAMWSFLCRLLPSGARLPVARAGHYSWHTLGAYMRATVFVAFVDAVGIGIGLAVMDIPLALPLTALVFLGAFVPVIGATVTGAVAVLVALVAQGPFSALVVLGIVIAVQQLEGHILQPLIMGRAVALHPLAVILAIASGAVLAGVVGSLVAVPLLAVLNTALRYLFDHPDGEPTPDRTPPGTEPADPDTAPEPVETVDPRTLQT